MPERDIDITCALRRYRTTDQRSLFELFSDPDVMKYVGDGRPIGAHEEPHVVDRIFAKYRTDPSFYIWAIEEDGEYAGHAELKRRGGRTEYELIYILQRRRWGRGLGKVVVDLLLADARSKHIQFVIATVHADNHASAAILKSRGFARDEEISAELETHAYRLVLEA